MPRRTLLLLYAYRWRVVLYGLLLLAVLGFFLHWFDEWEKALKGLLVGAGGVGFFVFTAAYNIVLVPFPYDPFLVAWAGWGHGHAELLQSAMVATGGMLVAALVDYAGGYYLRPRVEPWLRRQRGFAQAEKALLRYEIWAVALSAVTPIPFSLMCWLAGILRLPLLPLAAVVAVTRLVRNFLVLFLLLGA